jgi:hypothetical protein
LLALTVRWASLFLKWLKIHRATTAASNVISWFLTSLSSSKQEGTKMAEEKKFDVVRMMMEYENGDLDGENSIELFQYLLDTGMCWRLQGHYGRMAKTLIAGGYIKEKK